jgi:uncharacterized oxidoreductase
MKTTDNTILIMGGSAGIGFEIAKLFSEHGNHVIITGRNEERLQAAAAKLKNVTAINADVTNEASVNSLAESLEKDFPHLNILINNAGSAFVYNLTEPAVNAYAKAADEIETNYLSIIRLNEKLLPLLAKNDDAAIVNVTSIVAFAPNKLMTTYAASKAALHAYTRALRLSLAETGKVKVFELMPPLVDTEFSKDIGGHNGMPAAGVAQEFFDGLRDDVYEIHVGQTAGFYKLSLSSPDDALAAINQPRS